MSGHIHPIDDQSRAWQQKWEDKYAPAWRIANDGKYYPRRTVVKCKRKDIDDVIATVR